jgi:hypothetical protein
MNKILEVVIAVVITLLFFVILALFLPSSARVERSIEVGNPITQVYDTLNGFKRYNTWQPWSAVDPNTRFALEGADAGVGSKVLWRSFNNAVGDGSLEIVESEPDAMIRMALDNNWRGKNKTMAFKLEQNAQTNAVSIVWTIDVEYGWDLIGRFAGLYLNGRVGELMNSGLGRLASFIATIPNVDYSQVEVNVADSTPVDYIYLGASVPAAPRQWDEAESLMIAAWDSVDKFVADNKLEVLGPRRRIINVLGEETNDFNLSVPVAPHTMVPTAPIATGRWAGGRVITTQYRGHRVGLQKARDMLRAYAMTHGFEYERELSGLWEEWLPETDPENPQYLTNVYLPIR